MFQAKTTRGQASSGGAGKDLWTQHANAIVGMESMGQAGDPTCSKLSSCGECQFCFLFFSLSRCFVLELIKTVRLVYCARQPNGLCRICAGR